MAYTPPSITPGNPVEVSDVKARVNDFRTELNVNKLTQSDFAARTLTEENIARPELINHGSRVLETRLESGGLKWMAKPTANLYAIEDDSILDKSTGDPQTSPAPASTRPANSGANTMLHLVAEATLASGDYSQMASLPGCGITVNIERPSQVVVHFKTITNNMMNRSVSGLLGKQSDGVGQRLHLLVRKPDGTIERAQGKAGSRAPYTQSWIEFRDQHLFGEMLIDAADVGEYTWFVVAGIHKSSAAGALEGTHIRLTGKTDMSVEWWHRG